MASDKVLPDLKGKIGLTLGHLFALGLCLARSYLRVKKGRVWWDDRMVLGAAALDLIHMLTLWVKPMHPQVEIDGVAYRNAWLLSFFAYASTWLSRTSLWLSLARIYAPRQTTRRLAFLLAAVFGILGILSTISAVFGCGGSKWGTRLEFDRCFLSSKSIMDAPLNVKFSIMVVIVDGLCDITLVVVPAYILSNVRLRRKRKIAIILLGSGSLIPMLFVVTTIPITLATDSEDPKDLEVVSNILIHIMTFLVLISANILVVGAAIYGHIERRAREDATVCTHPLINHPNTSVIELTRISTSHYDSSLTGFHDDLDDLQEDSIVQESRPLFWSLVERRGREDAELSAPHRMTI